MIQEERELQLKRDRSIEAEERAYSRLTRCKRGHLRTERNTYLRSATSKAPGTVECKICMSLRDRERRLRAKQARGSDQ